jgi:hypothetical protein
MGDLLAGQKAARAEGRGGASAMTLIDPLYGLNG